MSEIITIKPCNVGWEKMSTEEKGRHCKLCSKTVLDFTEMKKEEIKSELNKYFSAGKSVCGHFLAEDVDEIIVEIPVQLLRKKMSFPKQFALALLVAMGTSLISCTNNQGKKEKLKEVVITEKVRGTDTISTEWELFNIENDSVKNKTGEIVSTLEGLIDIDIPEDEIKYPITVPDEPAKKDDDSTSILQSQILLGEPVVSQDTIVDNVISCPKPIGVDSIRNTESHGFRTGKVMTK